MSKRKTEDKIKLKESKVKRKKGMELIEEWMLKLDKTSELKSKNE